ncbi:peptide synthetase [Streptomyces sp. PRh5]|uniref:non-ribosomal peptide synthetase n=1 Tax=Streptomyces sp. PRh5 TaxID=1158056 RepID=UPI00044F6734|nr:amino acid adenylation domain-containing protein [Streptomyces sp. PRh5]EXU66161.1 peptide synthetase [Streptomyces sp. PRh5]
MNTSTSAESEPVAETFRAGPHQHDVTQDDTVTTLVLDVPASLSTARLADAVDVVARRHEALRTVLVPSPVGGPPTQRVFPEPLPESADRPWTVALVANGRVELSASAHALDSEGLLLLAVELERELRDGAGTGPDEDAPLQYVDVAGWLHDVLDDPDAARARAGQEAAHSGFDEAREVLAGLRSSGGAPSAAPAAGPQTVRSVGLTGPETETEALLLAGWLVVLHRFGGAQALTARVRTGLREVPQLRDVMGPLSIWLGLRHEFDADQTLMDVVDTVRAARAAQRENAELLGGLSEVTGPVGFSFAHVPERVGDWSVAALTARGTGPGLRLAAVRRGDSVELRLDGAEAVGLGAETTGRLLDAMAAVLEQIGRVPRTRIGRVVLGTPASPSGAPATPTAVDWQDATLPGLIGRVAARTPHAIALRRGNSELTYRRLLTDADRLAALLDAGPEDVVAILVPDPVARLVAQLAVVRAGAAYLIVDPDDPAERIASLLDEASARVCVATAPPPGDGGGRQLVLVPPGDSAGDEPDDDPSPVVDASPALSPDHLAYVLFTSGSTGRPKPVAVTHRNVVNYLGWLADTGLVGPDTVLPATAAPIFDAAVKQLWGPLVTGGTVMLPPADERPAETLAAAVSAPDTAAGPGVTSVNTVPRLWDETLRTLESADAGPLPRERSLDVLLGGEALTADLVERTRRILPGARLWNLYGPSETTANAAAGVVTDGKRISLGGPVGATTLHVLDEAMAPVPPGAIGELYIGGAGVARGYPGRGGLTAERFVPDPFSRTPGARLYRTGDLVRSGTDGLPEFRGRGDSQLKVRGHRIEPGEIEAVLLRHPAVTAVVADARDGRLVAWVVPGPDGPPTVEQLREHCSATLPSYLVPAYFVALDRVPLTAHGKTDRRALPDPEDGRLEQGGRFVAPRTPAEMVVAEIWRTVLGVARIGAHDSFFALGGDSIRAMHTVARARELTGAELPLRDLLSSPTVADQARLLLEHDQDGSVTEFVEVFAALDDPPDAPDPTPVAGSHDDASEEQS